MMMRMTTLSCILAGLIVSTPVWAQSKEFKIGFVMSLTGPGAPYGTLATKGMQAAVAAVNQSGGIGDMPARLVICDSQTVEQQAVLCVRKLLVNDQVNVLIGTGFSAQNLAVLPIVDQVGAPFFTIGASPLAFRPLKKWAFKSTTLPEDEYPSMLAYLKSKGHNSIGLIIPSGAFGDSAAKFIEDTAPKVGLSLVAKEMYALSDTDMTAQISRIRSANPDVVLNLPATTAAGAAITKKMDQLGMKQTIVVGINMQTPEFLSLVGPLAEQLLYVGIKSQLGEFGSEALAPFYRTMEAELKKIDPNAMLVSPNLQTADSVLLTREAAKNLGEKALDRETLLKSIESLNSAPGLLGRWTFSNQSHETNLSGGVTLLRYKDGKLVAAQ